MPNHKIDKVKDEVFFNRERIVSMETKLKDVCDDLAEIKADIRGFVDSADSRYASKRTEQLFYSVIGAAMIYILYKIIELL